MGSLPRKPPLPAGLSAAREQVIAFRLARLGLHRVARDAEGAVGDIGLPDFPPGAALGALAPRLAGASPRTLADAFDRRTLVRLRAMRGAPVVVRTDDFELFAAGVLPPDEPSMRAFIGPAAASVDQAGMTAVDAVELVTDRAASALSAGPLDRDQLHAELRRGLPAGLLPYCRPCDSHHVHPSLLYAVALRARLVVLPRDDGPYVVARFDRWKRSGKKAAVGPSPATELLRRFLRAYGPTTVAAFAAWAGIATSQARAAWDQLADDLVPVAVEGASRPPVHLLRADARALARASASQTTVRLLSPGDPLLQMRDRDLLVDAALQKVVWKNLSPTGLVMVGSRVAALARPRKKGNRLVVAVEPLDRISPRARQSLADEAARLAAARGCSDAQLAWT